MYPEHLAPEHQTQIWIQDLRISDIAVFALQNWVPKQGRFVFMGVVVCNESSSGSPL